MSFFIFFSGNKISPQLLRPRPKMTLPRSKMSPPTATMTLGRTMLPVRSKVQPGLEPGVSGAGPPHDMWPQAKEENKPFFFGHSVIPFVGSKLAPPRKRTSWDSWILKITKRICCLIHPHSPCRDSVSSVLQIWLRRNLTNCLRLLLLKASIVDFERDGRTTSSLLQLWEDDFFKDNFSWMIFFIRE